MADSGPMPPALGAGIRGVQRMLKRPPSEAELELVRRSALRRLGVPSDPDGSVTTDTSAPADAPDDREEPGEAEMDVIEPMSETVDPSDPWVDRPEPDQPRADGEPDAATEASPRSGDGESTRPAILVVGSGVEETAMLDIEPASVVADLGPTQTALFAPDDESGVADDAPPAAIVDDGDDGSVEPAPVDLQAPTVDASAATPVAGQEPVAIAGPTILAYCPSCATELDSLPRSTRRCARCKQRIVVRHVGPRTVLLTESALPVFEAEQRRLAEVRHFAGLRDHWLDLALRSGAPHDRIGRAASEEATEGRVAAARAMYLAAVERSFERATQEGRWEDAARIRYDEALVLYGYVGAPLPSEVDGAPLPVGWVGHLASTGTSARSS